MESLISSPYCTIIKELHSVVGQIISLSPVIGTISRLMTRYSQIADENDEGRIIQLDYQCRQEIEFWLTNVSILNVRFIRASPKVKTITCLCTDASSVPFFGP